MKYLVAAILAVGVLGAACGGSGGSGTYLVLPGLAIKQKDYQSFLGSKALDWQLFCGKEFQGRTEPLRIYVEALRQASVQHSGVKLSDTQLVAAARKYAHGLTLSSDYVGSSADMATAIAMTKHYCDSH